jgi:hypothetical protein
LKIENVQSSWNSNPFDDYIIDNSEFSEILKKKSGIFKEVDETDSSGTNRKYELSIFTCKKYTYRIFKQNSGYSTTTINVPVRHYIKIESFINLFVSNKASEEQIEIMKDAFSNADSLNPDISGIIAKIQNLGISDDLYWVVPAYDVNRYKIKEDDIALNRLISLTDPDMVAEYFRDTTLSKIPLRDWLSKNPLNIIKESVVHKIACEPIDKDPLREVSNVSEIDDAVERVNAISRPLDCGELEEKHREKLAVLAEYPEFKIVWKKKRIKIGCSRITIEYPQLQIRWSREELFFSLSGTKDLTQLIRNVAIECGILSFAIAGAVGYITGNFKVALKAFKVAMTYCLERRLIELPSCLNGELFIAKRIVKDWKGV